MVSLPGQCCFWTDPQGVQPRQKQQSQEVPPFNHKEGSVVEPRHRMPRSRQMCPRTSLHTWQHAHLVHTHQVHTHTHTQVPSHQVHIHPGTQLPGAQPPGTHLPRYTFTRYTPRQHTHPDNTHTQVHTLAIHPGNTPRECIHLGNTHVYTYRHEFCTTYTKSHEHIMNIPPHKNLHTCQFLSAHM